MESCSKGFQKALVVLALSVIGIFLNGCRDIYMDTCVWHSDMAIKGCSYYGFRSCIQHCHYCITQNGPNECDQLKCVAYCSKKDDDDCLKNFIPLCQIAVTENMEQEVKENNITVRRDRTCDVDCSGAASQNPAKVMLFAAVGFLFTAVPTRHATIGALLIFAAANLHGCCTDPEKQLDWEPEMGDFKKKADWVDDKGIWRGNPTWRFHKEIEVEDYKCKAVSVNGTCMVWTLHEWNCNEHDFGICKCYKVSDWRKGHWCEEWGCHALEADQQVCYLETSTDSEGNSHTSEKCRYDPFPMNEETYLQLVNRQNGGALTTGEVHVRWWSYSPYYSPYYRRLEENSDQRPQENEEVSPALAVHPFELNATDLLTLLAIENERENNLSNTSEAHARRLWASNYYWPPASSYMPAARHTLFRWGTDVCIVNGDNKAIARRTCSAWREIETEIAQCKCSFGEDNRCQRWHCEERDVGLFSIMFRTRDDIAQWTEGSETETYECTQTSINGDCEQWDGFIQSREEVEWTHCECRGGASCKAVDAVWLCDEYELPKTMNWNHPHYEHRYLWFVFFEIFGVCVFCRVFGDDADAALPVGLCCSCTLGICLLPWLIVTYGAYAWLAIGLPFWAIRACFCCAMFTVPAFKAASEAVEGAMEKPQKQSSREKFKRGASKIIGKKRGVPVEPQ